MKFTCPICGQYCTCIPGYEFIFSNESTHSGKVDGYDKIVDYTCTKCHKIFSLSYKGE